MGVSVGEEELPGVEVGVSVGGTTVLVEVDVGVSVVVAAGVELAVGIGVFTNVVKLRVALWAVTWPAEFRVATE